MTGDLPAGMVLGACRIVGLIGRGGMGDVYLAEHQVLQKSVVVKTARIGLQHEPHDRDRFLKEARLAARVEHPNVIPIYDAGDLHGLLYIVMQFVKGHDLSQVLKGSTEPLDWRQVLTWIRDAANGLAEVHAHGLIHRDIKPHNLMLTASGRVLLMDFGLVREENSEISSVSGVVGSPAYMSPEQCRCDRLDHRTDIYSLGATAYCLLSGNPPFQDKSVHLMIMKLAHNAMADRLDSIRSDIPPEVSDLIATAMEPTRERRTPDARTLALQIEDTLARTAAPAVSFGTLNHYAISQENAARPPKLDRPYSPTDTSALYGKRPTAAETIDASSRGTHQLKPSAVAEPRSRRGQLWSLMASIALMVLVVAGAFAAVQFKNWKDRKADPIAALPTNPPSVPEEKGSSVSDTESHPKTEDPDSGLTVVDPGSTTGAAGTPMPEKPEGATDPERVESTTPEPMPMVTPVPSVAPPAPAVVPKPVPPVTLPEKPPVPAEPVSKLPVAGMNPGDEWTLDSLAITFHWCPAGEFIMGSPTTEKGGKNEKPVSVTLTRGFWMSQTEVTQAQWTTLMQTSPWMGKPSVSSGEKFPAVSVCHSGEPDSAVEFCEKLTQQEQKEGRLPAEGAYRLPTEAEWEYACRAGTSTAYGFGPNAAELPEHGWFSKNADGVVHPVGVLRPNRWGLKDMHGNVYEWCLDGFNDRLPGGKDPRGIADIRRVSRGGGCKSDSPSCRSAKRMGEMPSRRHFDVGFRIVLIVP